MGFGEAISKQFVDALETGQDARAAMNLHNNEAGRKVSPSFPPELTVHTKLALNIHCGESQFAVAKITEETASGGRQQLYNGVLSKVAKLLCYSVNDFLQSSFSQFTVGGAPWKSKSVSFRTTVWGELIPNSSIGLEPCFCMHCSTERPLRGFFPEPLSLLTL